MCVETVRQYTCGCEEVEEIIFCGYLLQPEKGHSNGQRTCLQIIPVEIIEECGDCATMAEELRIAEAKVASTEKDNKATHAGGALDMNLAAGELDAGMKEDTPLRRRVDRNYCRNP